MSSNSLVNYDTGIANLVKAKESLTRESKATGRSVIEEIADIESGIHQMERAAAESAFRYYRPHEAAARDRERER